MKKGFTLVEVLVVFVIITLVSTILIVNWRKNEKRYLVQRVAHEIVQNIRKSQDRSLNSYEHNGEVYDYGVRFALSNPNSYILFTDINGNGKYNGGELVDSFIIEPGVRINALSTGPKLDVIFSVPDGFTNIYQSVSSAVITITKDDGTGGVSIEIMQTGQVNIQ